MAAPKFAILRNHNGRWSYSELVEIRRTSARIVYYLDSVGAVRQRTISAVTVWDATPQLFATLRDAEQEHRRGQLSAIKAMSAAFDLRVREIVEQGGGRLP